MIRNREPSSGFPAASRRNLLRFGLPAAAALVGAGVVTSVAANASENGIDAIFGPSREELEADLASRVEDYLADTGTQVEASAAVERGDMVLHYNPDQTHITASIVKVEIMTMLQEHWGSVEAIPEDHMALLEAMIRESDNTATSTLYDYLGGVDALVAAHERYGLTDTTPDSQGRWGVGWSSAPDQLRVVEVALYREFLDADQVALARDLMGGVIAEQAWGVSAAAKDGETTWLKNGWDTESQLGGLWVVNSIGVLDAADGHPVKLAILTSGAVDDAEGIPIVEEIARIARDVIETE